MHALKTVQGNLALLLFCRRPLKGNLHDGSTTSKGKPDVFRKAHLRHLSPQTPHERDGVVYSESADSTVVESTGGRWSTEEKREHINVLELKASLLGIKAFQFKLRNVNLKLTMVSTTAISYVSRMGDSHSHNCTVLAF